VAEYALPPGAIRRRALFGLLDADGWTWAGLKATFWFLIFIFTLGYIPNLAYYFTVSNTVDVGYNFLSVVNWCPTTNVNLPCPAPVGAVVPWQESPPELALPSGRKDALAFSSGSRMYLIGGETAEGATADVLETSVTDAGNYSPWFAGPALPEPRTDAALALMSGTPYVIGGLDASGQPTATVYQATVEEGTVTGWVLADGNGGTPPLSLPAAVSGASAVVSGNSIYLMGGRTADGLTATVLSSTLTGGTSPVLQAWTEQAELALPAPTADGTAASIGEHVYFAGGETADGVTRAVFVLPLDEGVPITDETGRIETWAPTAALPAPRAEAGAFVANGAFYQLGGVDDTGAQQSTTLWGVPDINGVIGTWQRLDQTDLPEPRAAAPVATVGQAFLIGGEGPDGLQDSTYRANLSPAPPFFRLGAFGATIPALAIEGEIGQQLGYLNAMGVGMVNFAVLVLIAWAFSHRAQFWRFTAWLTRGRIRGPREDEFTPTS
jgi:N-acetylneuraminic acid mutarotase